jgi:hypothetical protein
MNRNGIEGILEDEEPEISGVAWAKLSKDLKTAAETLTVEQVRYLVDTFYQVQQFRIEAAGQERASKAIGEPTDFVTWISKSMKTMEGAIQAALDKYTSTREEGRWAKSIVGIGPVLSAGLLAHIDVSRTETAGAIWRFAGLDPSVKWIGKDEAKALVKTNWDKSKSVEENARALALLTGKKQETVIRDATPRPTKPKDRTEDILELFRNYWIVVNSAEQNGTELFYQFRETNESLAEAAELIMKYGVDWTWDPNLDPEGNGRSMANLVKMRDLPVQKPMTRDSVEKALAKRPWNARLKVLCYKIGESFIKQQNHANDTYGKLYVERKAREHERNGAGLFAEQATAALAAKNYQRETRAKTAYESGRLPDAHVHARARRYAVKMFLSHYHHVAYEVLHGTPPPRPFVIEHMGHVEYVRPPNWPMKSEVK